MTRKTYCGNLLWQSGLTLLAFVWSSLGFYPVCPGSQEYALGAPQVSCAILSLGGRTLTIRANGVDGRPVQDFTATPYVEKATLNGAALERNYVTRAELQAGGELVFTMSPFPNRSRGTGLDAAPYSLSAPH